MWKRIRKRLFGDPERDERFRRRDEDIAKTIEQFGWMTQSVLPEENRPPFAYSIGFCRTFRHPEVLILGARGEAAHQALTAIAAQLKEGVPLDSERDHAIVGRRAAFRPVPRAALGAFMGAALDHYRERKMELRALQMFVADERGKFPWDEGCDPEYARRQPDLRKLAELASAASDAMKPKKN